MSLTVKSSAPVSKPVASSVPAAPVSSAPAMAQDSLATSKLAKSEDKGGHGWKIFGIAGLTIGGLSLAALGTGAFFALKALLQMGESIG